MEEKNLPNAVFCHPPIQSQKFWASQLHSRLFWFLRWMNILGKYILRIKKVGTGAWGFREHVCVGGVVKLLLAPK